MAGGSWLRDPVASFASTITVLPALNSFENWHECSVGYGRQLEGLDFGILCMQRAQLRAERAQQAL